MHIADGIIDSNICIAAHVVSVAIIYVAGKKTPMEEIPRMGITGAALFVASLIHIPFAGTSFHAGLIGIAGILLGKRSFPVIFTVLLFQSLIFQHGGLLSVGINSLNMGAGAYAAWIIWKQQRLHESFRAIAGGVVGIIIPALLMSFEFQLSGYGKGIIYLFSVYLIVAAIEGGITFFAVQFFRNIKSDILTLI
jgi:cobalt/nickel transport system permease protein